MRSIEIIRNEHRNLGAVLYSLDQLVIEIENGKQPDFSVFHGLLTYIDRFLDRFHHPKENEFLFPRVLARDPTAEALVRELGQQHTEGEILFAALLKALSAYQFIGDPEFPAFRDAVARYTEFERQHARLEESELLPRAKAVLETSDWKEIDTAFGENQDPMFGTWETEFSALFEQLVNALPAPLGLGEVWK